MSTTRRPSYCDVVVALVGAPNSGKTTLFNVITGRGELVANWPGATVEVKHAVVEYKGKRLCIVDLPGAYSLLGGGSEEEITKRFIIEEAPDVVVVLVDSISLERGLYLPLELLELHGRVVIALTKADEAERRGIRVDVDSLSKTLGVPVVMVSALRGEGITALLDAILEVSSVQRGCSRPVDYGELEPVIGRIEEVLGSCGLRGSRWLALALLAGDEYVHKLVEERCGGVAEALKEARQCVGVSDPLGFIMSRRYEAAGRLYRAYVHAPQPALQVSRLDKLLLHPLLGPIASLASLLIVFALVFAVNTGFPLNVLARLLGLEWLAELIEEYSISGLLGEAFNTLASWARTVIPDKMIASLVADGIIGGIGSVLSFLPLIAMVFLVLAILEDSGLLPRMAAGVDPLMRWFGLTGRCVFPLLVGLGCNVPCVVATRILSGFERLAVILLAPLVPCQARLFVALAIATAVAGSPLAQSAMVAIAYLVSLAFIALGARLFMLFTGSQPEEMVIEQPPLKKPSLRVVFWTVWGMVKHFLARAATIIFAMSVVVWALTSLGPSGYTEDPTASYAAVMGKALAPLVSLVFGVPGEDAWRLGFAFTAGLAAKEVLIESLAMTSPSWPEAGITGALRSLGLGYGQWLAVLVASTLYMPCIATMAIVYTESRSLRILLASLGYSIASAILAALAVRLAFTLLP